MADDPGEEKNEIAGEGDVRTLTELIEMAPSEHAMATVIREKLVPWAGRGTHPLQPRIVRIKRLAIELLPLIELN
jgi:hypothetical protein